MSVIGAVAALALAANVQDTQAFTPVSFVSKPSGVVLFAEEGKPDAVFVPDTPAEDSSADEEEDIGLESAELLGRGAAKVRHFIVSPSKLQW